MKRIITLVLALLLLAALCGCTPAESITFKNDHLCDIHGIYISPISEEEWTDSVNYTILKKDATLRISFKKFAADTDAYDVGVLDDTDMFYEFFEVPLAVGDALAFSGTGMFGTLTVTSADGSVETYEGYGSEVETTSD